MIFAALLVIGLSVQDAQATFDDESLDELLRREPRFAVCVWSPHMPLSVEAVREAVAAGRSLDLRVIAVLDPRADRGYAAATVDAARLPPDVLRVVQSTRLMRANAFQHAPTVIAFANGRQAGPPIVGYRDAHGYELLLRERYEEGR